VKKSLLIFSILIFILYKFIIIISIGSLSPSSLEKLAYRWDGEHFIKIACYGYKGTADFAFAPLYPLLVKAGCLIGLKPWVSALLVSNISSVLLFFVLYKLYNPIIAAIILSFPPFPLYTTTAYSEATALLLVALGYLLLRREKLLLSGLVLGAAIATRYTIGIVALTILLLLVLDKKLKGALWFIIGLLPAATSILYLFYNIGGSLTIYFEAEKYWEAGIATPVNQAEWLLHSSIPAAFSFLSGIPIGPEAYLARNIIFYIIYLASTAYLVALRIGEIIKN
jgi:hypothetical protein